MKMLEVIYIFLVLLLVEASLEHKESNFSDYDIAFVHIMHSAHCIESPVCVNRSHEHETFSSLNVSRRFPSPDPPPHSMNDGSCCLDCSCVLDRCTPSGTCCPDLLDYLPTMEESASRLKMICQTASLKKAKDRTLPVGLDVWMFTKCPDGYLERETKDKCEYPEEYTGWDTKIPVIHDGPEFNTNYQNVHCAICNSVSRTEVINWEVAVHCSKGEIVPSSTDTILDEVITSEYCNIVYHYPLNDNSMDTCEPVISSCNQTGLWEEYDPVIEAACHAYIAIYEGMYKNIFCYLCNMRKPYDLIQPVCVYQGGGPVWPSFSALLKFTEPQQEKVLEEKENNCTESQIFDKYEVKLVSGFYVLLRGAVGKYVARSIISVTD